MNDEIEEVKKKLLNYPNVQAVGRGKPERDRHTENIVLVAYVTDKVSEEDLEEDDIIPKESDGYTVDVQPIGSLALEVDGVQEPQDAVENESINTQEKHRPAPHGVSAGHQSISAGTAGLILWKKENVAGYEVPVPKTVSNNHVYAASNKAEIGDSILQPGPYDGGRPEDEVATLEGYVELKDEGNKVDLAWADINGAKMNSYINTVGIPTESTKVSIGDTVEKFGRTTANDSGEVLSTDARVRVNYGSGVKEFEDQILAKSFSAGGDSGSAVVDSSGDFAGMLFAGSSKVTVVNKAEHILEETGMALRPEKLL